MLAMAMSGLAVVVVVLVVVVVVAVVGVLYVVHFIIAVACITSILSESQQRWIGVGSAPMAQISAQFWACIVAIASILWAVALVCILKCKWFQWDSREFDARRAELSGQVTYSQEEWDKWYYYNMYGRKYTPEQWTKWWQKHYPVERAMGLDQ